MFGVGAFSGATWGRSGSRMVPGNRRVGSGAKSVIEPIGACAAKAPSGHRRIRWCLNVGVGEISRRPLTGSAIRLV